MTRPIGDGTARPQAATDISASNSRWSRRSIELAPGLQRPSVDVGAAVAPGRGEPARDRDRGEDDERGGGGAGLERHVDVGREVEDRGRPADDREPRRAFGRVRDGVLPQQDEGEPPPGGAPEPEPGRDEEAGVRERGERGGENAAGATSPAPATRAEAASGTAVSGTTTLAVASTAAAGSCQRGTGFSQR